MTKLIFILSILFVGFTAKAETVKLGKFSRSPGYFVRVGLGSQDVLNAVVMTPEAAAQIAKVGLKADINQTKTCDVDGLAQSIGYTIWAVKSCR